MRVAFFIFREGRWLHNQDYNDYSIEEAAQHCARLWPTMDFHRLMFWATEIKEILEHDCSTTDFKTFRITAENENGSKYSYNLSF